MTDDFVGALIIVLIGCLGAMLAAAGPAIAADAEYGPTLLISLGTFLVSFPLFLAVMAAK